MNFFKKNTPVAKRDDLITVSKPFECPASIEHQGPKEIGPEDQVKYDEILAHFQDSSLEINVTEDGQSGGKKPLTTNEKFWLTRECILRYLRATKGDPEKAIERLEYTLAWRREFGLSGDHEVFTAESISHENKTGKQVVLGFDKSSRPLLYFKPGRQNTKASIKQVQSTVWFLERTIDLMPQGEENLCLLIDFKSHKVEGETSKIPSIHLAKQVLHILQSHYPERLGKALFINLPFVALTFLKLITPFLDPVTKEKLVFDTDFNTVVDDDELDSEYNGRLQFEYDHEVYYPALIEVTDKVRQRMCSRFGLFGSAVGSSEYDLKSYKEKLQFPVKPLAATT